MTYPFEHPHAHLIDLSEPFQVGDVTIPGRIALAPMAGVSVQAFRRQGKRFGAGLVCSEMVSSCGLAYGNGKTQGYLRLADDESPLAVQLFGTDPALMADAAVKVTEAGADLIDINMGCPVKKVTKTAAGCKMLDDHDLAVRVAAAVVQATPLPVMAKLRRGMRDGSRDCLLLGPRLVEESGVSALTLHPRSAAQMYTGFADHTLTAELVQLVDVPVFASGDVTSRERAQAVIADTGAAAVMIGRAAQGNPWALAQMAGLSDEQPCAEERVAELVVFARDAVKELGEHRAHGFLRKFYGWYLRGDGFTRELRNQMMTQDSFDEVEVLLLERFPGAQPLIDDLTRTHVSADTLLDLPISVYGGG